MWLDKVACFKLNEVGWPLESLKLPKNFFNIFRGNKIKCHGQVLRQKLFYLFRIAKMFKQLLE